VPIDLDVRAEVGLPLVVAATAASGHSCQVVSSQPCEEARKHPLSVEQLREQFGRLGGTPLELANLTAEIVGQPMLPLSVLGKMRHELVTKLIDAMQAPASRQIAAESCLPALRAVSSQQLSGGEDSPNDASTLHVLVRSLAQLREVLAAGCTSLYADFADIREYREATQIAHAAGATIGLATPRIQKPDELGIFHALAKHGADAILVRNLAGLRFFHDRGLPVIADFSLNAANDLTAAYLREQGAARITPSYDLNREQLLDLVRATPPVWLEVVVHQHMPMFHMEHCVFCAVLSPGTNKTNCGRPCDVHAVKLRDRLGMEHPLTADVGCRNTLFNAVPQSGAEIVPQLLAAGVRHFRIELLETRGDAVRETIALYRALLAGQITGREVWTRLQASNRIGVTRGTLEERRNPLAIL
jgi:putative protease